MKFKLSLKTPFKEYSFATGSYRSEEEAFRQIRNLQLETMGIRKRLRALEEVGRATVDKASASSGKA